VFQGLEFWADSMPARRRRGRPEVDSEPVTVRLPREMLDALDAERERMDFAPSRPVVLRAALVAWLRERGALK
jgi:hypothetical protein